MPDIGDLVEAALAVDPADGTTLATLTVFAPDGTSSTPTPTTADTGATWRATYTSSQAGWWLLVWTVTGTGAGVENQRVFVPANPTYGDAPAYASVEQLRDRLGIAVSTEDEDLADALDSASREVDNFCGRRFWSSSTATARTYRPRNDCVAVVDDLWTTTGLVVAVDTTADGTYATTWTLGTDFVLEPLNGVVDGVDGWPYWKIRAVGTQRFPCYYTIPPLRVTAKWGWAAIPKPVRQATLIMAQANYKLKDVAFGAAGVGDLGIITVRQNPAAMTKLNPYVREPARVA